MTSQQTGMICANFRAMNMMCMLSCFGGNKHPQSHLIDFTGWRRSFHNDKNDLMMLDEELECRSLLGSNGSFLYLHLSRGFRTVSQVDIYSAKSHRSKEVSGFWLWSRIGNWYHMMICGSATDVPIDLCGSTFPPFTYTWNRCQNTSFPKKHLTSSLTVTSSPSTHTFSILTHWPTVQLEGKLWRGQPSQLLSPPSYDTGVHPWVLLDSGSFQHCAALDTDPFINHNARSNCNIWTLEGYY